jgi:hypothetical protein
LAKLIGVQTGEYTEIVPIIMNPAGSTLVIVYTPGDLKIMHKNRSVGTAKNIGRKAQESFLYLAGVSKIKAENAQDAYGQASEETTEIADAVIETAAVARRAVSSFVSSIRNAIETQPYTVTLVAFGLGWLWGRIHRPL